jgi:hypothetical protein
VVTSTAKSGDKLRFYTKLMSNLTVTFGKPEHGWLPVSIQLGEKRLEFDASDVPVNPVDELVEALLAVMDGYPKTVWWNLESLSYTFHFTPQYGEVEFRITFEGYSGVEDIMAVTLPRQEMLSSFWSAIQTLLAYKLGEHDWPEASAKNLKALEEKLQKLRA